MWWAGGAVSDENVELIRSIQPGPEADLVALFADAGVARQSDMLRPLLDPGFECAMHLFPGAPPTVYSGLDGLRACWRDWVAPWASYRTEIERLIDLGERAVTVVRDYGRREQSTAEVEMRAVAVDEVVLADGAIDADRVVGDMGGQGTVGAVDLGVRSDVGGDGQLGAGNDHRGDPSGRPECGVTGDEHGRLTAVLSKQLIGED